MCNLASLAATCGTSVPPGTKEKRYWTPISELTGWPATRAAGGGTNQGDTFILDEAFDFSGAGVGFGFWRNVSAIVVDTGELTNNLEGPIGGQGYRQRDTFFIKGNGPEVLEWINELVACSGCAVWLVPTKDGNYHVLGDPDNPVYVEVVEGGSGGERVGYQVTLYANTGKPTYIYDAATHGIDETANTV